MYALGVTVASVARQRKVWSVDEDKSNMRAMSRQELYGQELGSFKYHLLEWKNCSFFCLSTQLAFRILTFLSFHLSQSCFDLKMIVERIEN